MGRSRETPQRVEEGVQDGVKGISCCPKRISKRDVGESKPVHINDVKKHLLFPFDGCNELHVTSHDTFVYMKKDLRKQIEQESDTTVVYTSSPLQKN